MDPIEKSNNAAWILGMAQSHQGRTPTCSQLCKLDLARLPVSVVLLAIRQHSVAFIWPICHNTLQPAR